MGSYEEFCSTVRPDTQSVEQVDPFRVVFRSVTAVEP